MVERWLEARAAGRSFRLHYDWVPLERTSNALRAAVVTSEDQRFRTHRGFDFEAMRDALEDSRRGRRLRGASTITQQVAKNLFLWSGRSFVRKGLEAWLTVWIELLWSKDRILEVYLNLVELGDGVFGVEAAARRYFGKSAAGLGSNEAALLAAVLPSPRRSSVANPSAVVRERQRWILAQIAPRPAEPPAPAVPPPTAPLEPPPALPPEPPIPIPDFPPLETVPLDASPFPADLTTGPQR
jgi:monofunctional biosynthetic peptidoglycan transglycosylase